MSNQVIAADCDYCHQDLEMDSDQADKRRLSHNRFVCDNCLRRLLRDPWSEQICSVSGCKRHKFDGSDLCFICINEIYERENSQNSSNLSGDQ